MALNVENQLLSSAALEHLPPQDVANFFLDVIAQRALVLNGKLLRVEAFNIRPHVNFNLAIGRGLTDALQKQAPGLLSSNAKIAVAAVENSASYVTFGLAQGLQVLLGVDDLSIQRIRKGSEPSILADPLRIVRAPVYPVTRGILEHDTPRWLHAEIPDELDRSVDIVIVSDDVEGSGSTLQGAERIAHEIYPNAVLARCTVFRKDQQRTVPHGDIDISLLAIEDFHWEESTGVAILKATGFQPRILERVKRENFHQ